MKNKYINLANEAIGRKITVNNDKVTGCFFLDEVLEDQIFTNKNRSKTFDSTIEQQFM